jgi:DNA-binding NtrC family response regulator
VKTFPAQNFFIVLPEVSWLNRDMPERDLIGLSILIVEDDPLLRKQLAYQLEQRGADVTVAETLSSAQRWLTDFSFDFVLLDVNLPDGLGTELLKSKLISANTGTIVMTADGVVSGAVAAMRLGALDYLVKPFELEEVSLAIDRVRRARQSVRLAEHRRSDVRNSGEVFFFGSSLNALENQLQRILTADSRMQGPLPPVLIQGETGTGKTTIARWLHHRGPRAAQPLVEVNCSALPETLAESELFGHERGAFTDARTARIGLFEAASGGTLFLDELPSLSLVLQAKVLKVLEDHRIRRLGGNKEIPVDVRVIAATHRDLKQLVSSGQFREDLYHRLDLYRVRLAPLRERGEDIEKLAGLLIEQISQRHRLPKKALSSLGRQRLLACPWPGNVRELGHELERAIVFEEGSELNLEHLQQPGSAPLQGPVGWFHPDYIFPPQGFLLDEAIDRLIQHALKQSGNNVSAAARLLGVTRDYLRYHLANRKQSTSDGA